MPDRNPDRIVKTLTKEKKPLHVRSLEEQVSWNPRYKAVVDSFVNKDEYGKRYNDVHDAYFYGLKDAYEKTGYKPTEDDIRRELSDRYWGLADDYRFRHGLGSAAWDNYGWADFDNEYGSEDDFIEKLIDAYKKTWRN